MQRDETGDGKVAQGSFDRIDAVDQALRYTTFAMFNTLHTLVENTKLAVL